MYDTRQPAERRTTLRKVSVILGVAAVIGMGGVTVACSPRSEQPAETTGTNSPAPTEKGLRTNVTRSPIVATPGGGVGGGGGNAAVPCGFGPSGGAPCSNR